MTRYLSISQKIFILMLFLMFFILAVVITITVTESRSSKNRMEQEYIETHQGEFMIVKRLHSKNLSVLLEAEIEQANHSLAQLINALNAQMSFWQLNELVSHAWISDGQGEMIYQSSPQKLPFEYIDIKRQVLLKQVPQIWCEKDCFMYVAVPFIESNGKRFMVYVSQKMTIIMADLYQTTGALISQVNLVSDMQQRNHLAHHTETSENTKTIYAPVNKTLSQRQDDAFLRDGISFDHQERTYFVSFVHINPMQDDSPQYFIFLQDVQSRVQTRESFAVSIIVMAILVLILFGVIFHLFTAKYRKRLSNLVERFSIIKDNHFEAFNEKKLKLKRFFSDELDTLDSAAIQFAKELNELHKKMSADQSKLRFLAMYDELTQLANRNNLNEYLHKSMIRMHRYNKPFGVILIDLDEFKKVNDTQGHTVGDHLLQQVAERLLGLVRKKDFLCRFRGDEFVIVVDGVVHEADANMTADNVIALFEKPFVVNSLKVFVSVSLGVTICNSAKISVDEIIRQVDMALNRAKEVRGNSKRIYDEVFNDEVIRKIELEHEARLALQNNDFYLALQPIIDMRNNDLHGFEALLRWRHPKKGLISPAEFIPILENSTFMLNLDYYVLERSIKTLQALNNQGYENQTIAVNLSATQFLDRNLIPYLESTLTRYQIRPDRLELELTEGTLVSDIKHTLQVMRELRKVGVKISIDDFGTGYSSLSYLSKMPVTKIKIDRSFIHGMLDNKTDELIVISTIDLIHNIGMTVVAEGVETLEQYVFLQNLNCDFIQGFLVTQPIPEHQLKHGLAHVLLDQKWVQPKSLSSH